MRFNKWMEEDSGGRYEHDSGGIWWYCFGVKNPNRTRATLRECVLCGRKFLDMPMRSRGGMLTRFCSRRCSGLWMYQNGKTPVGQKGNKAPRWNGGTTEFGMGYVNIHMPDHPLLKGTKRKYVRRCRWVMEQHLGRPLEPWEQVHHKNGQKDDDRIENLELWLVSHPAGVRDYYCPRCDCAGCKGQRVR